MNAQQDFASLTVNEYTSPGSKTVTPETPVEEVAKLMEDNSFRHVPVIEKGQPLGVISDRDVKTMVNFGDYRAFKAKDIMSVEPFVVNSDQPLEEVAMIMSEHKIGSVLVKDIEDESIGIFTSTDALNALVEILRKSDR